MTKKPTLPRLGASQSFNEAEVQALDVIVSTILRGGDTRALQKNPAIAGLARKAQGMKASLERARAARSDPARTVITKDEAASIPAEGDVGSPSGGGL